jgi:hypothetical protein
VIALAVSLWCGSRWVELGRTVTANRRALLAALQWRPGDPPHDPSARVSYVIERDEVLFAQTLTLAAIRRTAGVLALAFGAASVLAAVASARRRTTGVDGAAR